YFFFNLSATTEIYTLSLHDALPILLIGNGQRGGTGYHHQRTVGFLDRLQVMQAHRTAMLDLDIVYCRRPARGTTDVEGTHGQLGTRFTDGLGSDNTYRFTHVHLVTTGQITTVTLGTDAVTGLTGNRRAHPDFVYTRALNHFDGLLVEQCARRNNGVVLVSRREHITSRHTTQNPVAQR